MSMRIDCGEYQLLKSQRNLKSLEPLEFIDESIYDGWNSTLEHLMIANNSLSDFNQTQLSITSLVCLRTISIGSDCFKNVTVFQLSNLPVLKSVVIGEGSFTPPYWKNDRTKQNEYEDYEEDDDYDDEDDDEDDDYDEDDDEDDDYDDYDEDEDEDEEEYTCFLCSNCPNLTTLVISPNAFVLYSSFTLSSEYKRMN